MTEIVSSQQALAIITNCPFPIVILDRGGRVTGYNSAFAELLGAEGDTALRGLAADSAGDHCARTLLTSANTVTWTDADSRVRHFEIHRVNLDDGQPFEARFYIDVTRQAELEDARNALNKQLHDHILTDPVTGLLNQRGVMLALEPQVARSRRYNSPISVIMLDISGGEDHQQVLIAVARLLKDQLRWADLVGCTEQQEFVLVLPETTAEAARGLADKLGQQLRRLAERICPANPLWPSYGITAWRKNDDASALLKRAAIALTRARSEQGDQLIAL